MMAVEEFLLEPGGVLARELDRGQRLQITDVQGQQVGDLVAFNRADLNEKFWISNTVRLNATVYLTTGERALLRAQQSDAVDHLRLVRPA
jgi:uncharacterized protein YcgI (DUF1989 family)